MRLQRKERADTIGSSPVVHILRNSAPVIWLKTMTSPDFASVNRQASALIIPAAAGQGTRLHVQRQGKARWALSLDLDVLLVGLIAHAALCINKQWQQKQDLWVDVLLLGTYVLGFILMKQQQHWMPVWSHRYRSKHSLSFVVGLGVSLWAISSSTHHLLWSAGVFGSQALLNVYCLTPKRRWLGLAACWMAAVLLDPATVQASIACGHSLLCLIGRAPLEHPERLLLSLPAVSSSLVYLLRIIMPGVLPSLLQLLSSRRAATCRQGRMDAGQPSTPTSRAAAVACSTADMAAAPQQQTKPSGCHLQPVTCSKAVSTVRSTTVYHMSATAAPLSARVLSSAAEPLGGSALDDDDMPGAVCRVLTYHSPVARGMVAIKLSVPSDAGGQDLADARDLLAATVQSALVATTRSSTAGGNNQQGPVISQSTAFRGCFQLVFELVRPAGDAQGPEAAAHLQQLQFQVEHRLKEWLPQDWGVRGVQVGPLQLTQGVAGIPAAPSTGIPAAPATGRQPRQLQMQQPPAAVPAGPAMAADSLADYLVSLWSQPQSAVSGILLEQMALSWNKGPKPPSATTSSSNSGTYTTTVWISKAVVQRLLHRGYSQVSVVVAAQPQAVSLLTKSWDLRPQGRTSAAGEAAAAAAASDMQLRLNLSREDALQHAQSLGINGHIKVLSVVVMANHVDATASTASTSSGSLSAEAASATMRTSAPGAAASTAAPGVLAHLPLLLLPAAAQKELQQLLAAALSAGMEQHEALWKVLLPLVQDWVLVLLWGDSSSATAQQPLQRMRHALFASLSAYFTKEGMTECHKLLAGREGSADSVAATSSPGHGQQHVSSPTAASAGGAAASSGSQTMEAGVQRYPLEFYLYYFKIAPCPALYPHSWSLCPFVHPNEKARRRDPRIFDYEPLMCPDDKKGVTCPRGDACSYTHNVYEYWLHPKKFRTQLCQQGAACRRQLCFFAHNLHELRAASAASAPADPSAPVLGISGIMPPPPSGEASVPHPQQQQHQQQQLLLVSSSPRAAAAARPSMPSQGQALLHQLGAGMGSLNLQAPIHAAPTAASGDWLQPQQQQQQQQLEQQKQQLGLSVLQQAVQQQLQQVSGGLTDADLGLAGYQARSLGMYQAAAAAGSHTPAVLLQPTCQPGMVPADLTPGWLMGQVGLPAGAVDAAMQQALQVQGLQGQRLQLSAAAQGMPSGELSQVPTTAGLGALSHLLQQQQQQQMQQDQQQSQWLLRLM